MIQGTAAVSELTGFVPRHAEACVDVARRLDAAILFREPGKSAQSLIADSYAMKGFRIDTKSCTWGPMRGFVCVDPRLSKAKADGGSYADKNREWTEHALTGHIVEQFFGKVDAADSAGWQADVMPIVIARKRIEELASQGHIEPKLSSGPGLPNFTGVSRMPFTGGTVTLPWRLMSARNGSKWWLKEAGAGGDYYAECLPVAGMLPFGGQSVVALQSVADFRELVKEARGYGYETRAKPSWLREAGLV